MMKEGDRVMVVIPAVIDDISNHGTPDKPNILAWLKLENGAVIHYPRLCRGIIVLNERYLKPIKEEDVN